jgi:hypothetical protein
MLQARHIVQSKAFAIALNGCVKHCAAHVATEISQQMQSRMARLNASEEKPSHCMALAHILPLISRVPTELLSRSSGVGASLVQREDFKALMTMVYAQGPFLDDTNYEHV